MAATDRSGSERRGKCSRPSGHRLALVAAAAVLAVCHLLRVRWHERASLLLFDSAASLLCSCLKWSVCLLEPASGLSGQG